MAGMNLPLLSPVLAVFFLILFAYSVLKRVLCNVSELHLRISGPENRDDQPSIKGRNTSEASFRQVTAITVEREASFSAAWWCQDDHFQLERRAIFSKTWMYTTHHSLFNKPGDYLTLSTAGFSFFLILGKDQKLRAFHNVCRHRAYEVTRKEHGSATVLGCRYHGWSYDTKGRLTKAPEFDTVPDFDKKNNGLWEIHAKINAQGLVFVNLDANETVSELAMGRLNPDNKYLNMSQSRRIAEWRHEGEFNWKTAGSIDSNIAQKFRDIRNENWVSGLIGRTFRQKRELHLQIDMFTTMSMHPTQAICLISKIIPQSATKTTIGFELYSWTAYGPPKLEVSIGKLKEATFAEIEKLQSLQKEIIGGRSLPHHVQMDQQNSINVLLVAHRKLERLDGTEIHPAARRVRLSGKGQEDVDLCKTLEKALKSTGLCPGKTNSSLPMDSLGW